MTPRATVVTTLVLSLTLAGAALCAGCRCSREPEPRPPTTVPTSTLAPPSNPPAPDVPEPPAVARPATPTVAAEVARPAVDAPKHATDADGPVLSLADAPRLLDTLAGRFRAEIPALQRGGQLVRSHAGGGRVEAFAVADAAFTLTFVTEQATTTLRGGRCSIGPVPGARALCEQDDELEIRALAAVWATADVLDGHSDGVRIERVGAPRAGQQGWTMQLSRSEPALRWWLVGDGRGGARIEVGARGVRGTLRGEPGGWRLTADGHQVANWTTTKGAHHQPRTAYRVAVATPRAAEEASRHARTTLANLGVLALRRDTLIITVAAGRARLTALELPILAPPTLVMAGIERTAAAKTQKNQAESSTTARVASPGELLHHLSGQADGCYAAQLFGPALDDKTSRPTNRALVVIRPCSPR